MTSGANMVSWLLQTNLIDSIQLGQVYTALRSQGIPYQGCHVIPFDDNIQFLEPIPPHKGVIPYGSTKLTRIAEEQGWTGMFFDEETFRVDTCLKNRSDMLNSDADIMLVRDLHEKFVGIADDEVFFIRPVKDLKEFNGTITTAKEIRNWMASVDSGNFSFSQDSPVVVASPKNILAEWRWFVVGGKIVSGSTYKMHGQRLVQRETDQAVIDEAQGLADKWLPNSTVVMDVALTKDGPKVIEFNCFNSSGFYYHDIEAVVTAVTQYLEAK